MVLNFSNEHPFIHHFVDVGGCCSLLQLGLALVATGAPPKLVSKLRQAGTFDGAEFEAWAGLFLTELGAAVEHEPGGCEPKVPDWKAIFAGDVQVFAEAKRPEWSAREFARHHAATVAVMHMSRDLASPFRHRLLLDVEVPDLHYEQAIRPNASGRYDVDEATARGFGERVAAALRTLLANRPHDGVHDAAGFAVSIRAADGAPGVQLSVSGSPINGEHERDRMGRLLRDAAEQTAPGGLPSILFVDAQNELGIGVRFNGIHRAMTEPPHAWRSHIAAVVSRNGVNVPDEPLPYTFIGAVGGPRFEEVRAFLEPVLVRCRNGHHHWDPLARGRRRDCTFSWF